jgi:hypothetical protein
MIRKLKTVTIFLILKSLTIYQEAFHLFPSLQELPSSVISGYLAFKIWFGYSCAYKQLLQYVHSTNKPQITHSILYTHESQLGDA